MLEVVLRWVICIQPYDELLPVAGAVRKNMLTAKATDQAVEDEIKEWLKFASKRLKQQAERVALQAERLKRGQSKLPRNNVNAANIRRRGDIESN